MDTWRAVVAPPLPLMLMHVKPSLWKVWTIGVPVYPWTAKSLLVSSNRLLRIYHLPCLISKVHLSSLHLQ